MSTEPEPPGLVRWMPTDIASASHIIEDRLLEVWIGYVQTIGPSVVSAYRAGKLKEQPSIHVFNRVSEKMQRVVADWLLREEMKQGKEELNDGAI